MTTDNTLITNKVACVPCDFTLDAVLRLSFHNPDIVSVDYRRYLLFPRSACLFNAAVYQYGIRYVSRQSDKSRGNWEAHPSKLHRCLGGVKEWFSHLLLVSLDANLPRQWACQNRLVITNLSFVIESSTIQVSLKGVGGQARIWQVPLHPTSPSWLAYILPPFTRVVCTLVSFCEETMKMMQPFHPFITYTTY